MNNKKISGLSTDPCGIPMVTLKKGDFFVVNVTNFNVHFPFREITHKPIKKYTSESMIV